jgi:hypothetical protein
MPYIFIIFVISGKPSQKADFLVYEYRIHSVSGFDCSFILTWEIFRGIFADSEAGDRAASHSEVSHWSPQFSAKQQYKNSLPLHAKTFAKRRQKKTVELSLRYCLCVC